MAITIDTSAVLAIVNNELQKATIVAAIGEAKLVSAASLPWEVGNAFSGMFKRRSATIEQAIMGLKIFQEMPIDLIDIPLEHAVRLSEQLKIYAYDASICLLVPRSNKAHC